MNNILNGYFNIKTKTKEFHQRMESIINSLKEKKVLVYGADAAFEKLNEQYNFIENLNIVAIADKRFKNNENGKFCGIKAILPKEIASEEFDTIVVMSEFYEPIVRLIHRIIQIKDENIIVVFAQKYADERKNLNYLYNINYEKNLTKLAKKLKGKNIVLYGAGVYLRLIFEYFDMSQFNISAISDKRFQDSGECTFNGYKTCNPHNIESFKPDYVLISTKYYIKIFEYLRNDILKNTNIKIMPLIDKPMLTLIKELWQS